MNPITVKALDMAGFTCHKGTKLDLPECGVVVVTGPNGSGKSSFIEAVSWGIWGKMLRGSHPHQPKTPCVVKVTMDGGHEIERERPAGGSVTVRPNFLAATFDTATKAQLAVNGVLGEHEVWRRTHVFSSADASTFSAASDADRKRLLEELLGLSRFDAASDLARIDRKAARLALADIDTDIAVQERLLQQLSIVEADANERIAKLAIKPREVDMVSLLDNETALVMEIGQRVKRLRKLESIYDSANDAVREAIREEGNDRGLASTATARYTSALVAEAKAKEKACGTCERDFDAESQKVALDAALAELAEAQTVKDEAFAVAENSRANTAELREEMNQARLAVQGAAKAHDSAKTELAEARTEVAKGKIRQEALIAWEDNAAAAELALEKAKEEVAEVGERLKVLAVSRRDADLLVETLNAVVRVLGLKGARAMLLGKALGGIEAVANTWLSRIAVDMKVTLSMGKGQSGPDSVVFGIFGAGGGRGYRAASGGERRRVDVAIVMALAEVCAGAGVQGAGTAFFDEVFDALDPEGILAVAGVLQEMARDRCVMVVTHNEELGRTLKPALWVRL